MIFDKKQPGEHLLEFKIISLNPNQQSFAKIENVKFLKINQYGYLEIIPMN